MIKNSLDGAIKLAKEGKTDSAAIAMQSIRNKGKIDINYLKKANLDTIVDLLMVDHVEAAKQVARYLISPGLLSDYNIKSDDAEKTEITQNSFDGFIKLIQQGKMKAAGISGLVMNSQDKIQEKYLGESNIETVYDLLMVNHVEAARQVAEYLSSLAPDLESNLYADDVSDIQDVSDVDDLSDTDSESEVLTPDLENNLETDDISDIEDTSDIEDVSDIDDLSYTDSESEVLNSEAKQLFDAGNINAAYILNKRLQSVEESLGSFDLDNDRQLLSSSPSFLNPSKAPIEETVQSVAKDLYNSYFGDHKNGADQAFFRVLKIRVPTPNEQLKVIQQLKTYVQFNENNKYQKKYFVRTLFNIKRPDDRKQRDRQLDQLNQLEARIQNELPNKGINIRG